MPNWKTNIQCENAMLLYYRMKDEFKQDDNTNEEKKIARNTLM